MRQGELDGLSSAESVGRSSVRGLSRTVVQPKAEVQTIKGLPVPFLGRLETMLSVTPGCHWTVYIMPIRRGKGGLSSVGRSTPS